MIMIIEIMFLRQINHGSIKKAVEKEMAVEKALLVPNKCIVLQNCL